MLPSKSVPAEYILRIEMKYFRHGESMLNFPFHSPEAAKLAGEAMMYSNNVIGYVVVTASDGEVINTKYDD